MSARVDLALIAGLVDEGARVLDIGCGNGDLLDLLVRERHADARGLELKQAGVNACVGRGLSVVQGNADTDLTYYPDNGFDAVILSLTLQATRRPHVVLREMARIGTRLIVSIPNFGHWRIRRHLMLHGRMPTTHISDEHWYDTANIHLCTLRDFTELCAALDLNVAQCITLRGKKVHPHASHFDNLFAELAVFVLKGL